MLKDFRSKVFDVPVGRWWLDSLSDFYDSKRLSWMVDFSPDSLINMRFRKEELTEFAMFGEGNVYNKLFYKVLSYLFTIHEHWKQDQKFSRSANLIQMKDLRDKQG